MSKYKAIALVVVVAAIVAVSGVSWGYAQQRKIGGTLSPADYIEIQQLYAQYARSIDAADGEAFAGTFTADGEFGGAVGRAALIEFGNHRFDRWNGAQSRHWNTNLIVTATPEGAKGSCYLMTFNATANPPTERGSGVYDDTLIRTAQGWRFKKRLLQSDGRPSTPSR
jgi:hypothetical protein